jgi:hypothetical protein
LLPGNRTLKPEPDRREGETTLENVDVVAEILEQLLRVDEAPDSRARLGSRLPSRSRSVDLDLADPLRDRAAAEASHVVAVEQELGEHLGRSLRNTPLRGLATLGSLETLEDAR